MQQKQRETKKIWTLLWSLFVRNYAPGLLGNVSNVKKLLLPKVFMTLGFSFDVCNHICTHRYTRKLRYVCVLLYMQNNHLVLALISSSFTRFLMLGHKFNTPYTDLLNVPNIMSVF